MSSETYAPATPAESQFLLRRLLQADAAISGANGLAYLAAAQLLDGPLGLSSTLLRGAGVVLVVFAIGVWLTASRPVVSDTAVRVIVAVNVVWALESGAALALGWISPTTGGGVWVALQAAAVGTFALLQGYARGR